MKHKETQIMLPKLRGINGENLQKRVVLLLTFILILLVFTACGSSVANEKKIKTDLDESSSTFFTTTESIDKVEIIKRNTTKDKKSDTVWCKIDSHDGEASYIKYFALEYQHYDKGGWVLEDMEHDQSDKWTATPLVGINDELLTDSLAGLRIKVDGEEWNINKDDIESVTVDNRDTKLEQKKDVITVTLVLNSDVLIAQGQIQIEYTYDNGWQRKGYAVSVPFESSFKQGRGLELTNDSLESAISKETISYGSGDTRQTITLSPSEITNISCDISESFDKGTTQKVKGSFELDKTIVIFDVEIEATYKYDSAYGWEAAEMILSTKVKSVHIEGEWSGEYNVNFVGENYRGLMFEISDVKPDGSFSVVRNSFTLASNPSDKNGPGQAVGVGGVDFKDLSVGFEEKEMVVHASENSVIQSWKGYLDVEKRAMISEGFGFTYRAFEVTRVD